MLFRSVRLDDRERFLVNIYAVKAEEGYLAYVKLFIDKDVSDWEFNAIFDHYDPETLLPLVESFSEIEDCYEPTWELTLAVKDNSEAEELLLGERLRRILELHEAELESVYAAISGKEQEYS